MYSLLNYVAATSKEIHDAPHNIPPSGLFAGLNGERGTVHSDRATLHSIDIVTHGHTEEERRLIATSTISVVSRLALEFKRDDVSAVVGIKVILFEIDHTGYKINNCDAHTTASDF
jgi:phosphatidylinositol 4-kinase